MIVKTNSSKKIMISLSASTKTQGVEELETLIQRAAKMYYTEGRLLKVNVAKRYPAATKLLSKQGINVDDGVEQINDEVFDLLWDVLTELKPESKVLQRTGVAVNNKTKTKLPYAMNGLSQVRPDDVEEWLRKHPGPYVVSDKMDGVSFEQVCSKSGKDEAYTKGDSDMGNRITPMLKHMNVPHPKEDIAVRAEMIMLKSVFDSKHSREKSETEGKKYENPRNMVAGATSPKRRDLHPSLRDIDVVAFELFKPRLKPSDQLKRLASLGYKVAPWSVYQSLDREKLVELFNKRRRMSPYELDGLVIAQDKTYPLATTDAPARHMVKFKFNTEESIVEVKVKDVVWEASKHGKLIPRVNIPSTRLAGVTVDFATGHNAFFIANGFSQKDKKRGLPVRPVGPGATIRITRSGDVIPYIVEVVKGVKKPPMPDVPYHWGESGVHIFADTKSDLTKVKRITYFFDTLKVEGLKQGTVQHLFNNGYDSILKIVRITKDELLELEGIQDKKASATISNLKTALEKMRLPELMDASGLFGQGMGATRITWVLKTYPDLLTRKEKPEVLADMIDENVKGFSSKLAKQLVKGLPKFVKFYKKLGIKAKGVKVIKQTGKAMEGKIIVWTGFRNEAQETMVKQQGGTVGSGVNSKTSILVVKDASFNSSKVEKARAAGVKVMTNDQFQTMLGKLK